MTKLSRAQYGVISELKLSTCHVILRDIFNEAIKLYDIKILAGARGEGEQKAAYEGGVSKVQWPNSKHNVPSPKDLSEAVDAAPYPIIWDDERRYYFLHGIILGITVRVREKWLLAGGRNFEIRWGGDWDSDTDFNDQKFNDLVHFEIRWL